MKGVNSDEENKNPKLRIVIIGAGFGGLRFLYDIKKEFPNGFHITLIDERETSLEKPSLVEVALAGKPVSHTQIPIDRIAKSQDINFINKRAEKIDPENNMIFLNDGSTLSYDYLIIAAGAVKDYGSLPGFSDFGYSVCDDYQAPRMWNAINNFKGGNVVIGAAKTKWGEESTDIKLDAPCEGPIGEIMFMLDYFLRKKGIRDKTNITVFTPGKVFFDDVGPVVHKKIEPLIKKKKIKVLTEKSIREIDSDRVIFEDGTELLSDLTLVIPPYTGPDVIKNSHLGDSYGFIRTDEKMLHTNFKNIYVVGDCNANSMPKLGHIAVLQADVAASSLIKTINGRGSVLKFNPEIFCIMNRGGTAATLILSDTLFGGNKDITLNGPMAHMMKWGFDMYSYYTRGKMPPELLQASLETMLKTFK
jgi:sulfide:quinone oxidoreductase